MDDCIYRQAALDTLEWKWAGKAAIDAIKNLPPADVEPVRRAKRIVICHEENSYSYACEACGIPVDICDNFCRGCGAKLDGGL